MPPPLFLIFIPSVALVFLIQILVCHAYHFQVSLARHRKRAASPDSEDNKNTSPGKKETSSPQKSGMGDQPEESDDKSTPAAGEQNRPRSTVGFDIPQSGANGPESPVAPESQGTPSSVNRGRRKSVFAESYDPSKDTDSEKIVHPKADIEKKWLRSHLKDIVLFKYCLAEDQVDTVVDAMHKVPVKEGEVIMKEGDKGNTFFVIQKGIYDVFVKEQRESDAKRLAHTYNNEGSFGELALLYNQPRAATIIARNNGILWAVDGQTFRRIVYRITYEKRQMYENLINNVDILKSLTPLERANLVDALVPKDYGHGERIFRQGDEADGMYFIVTGGARVMCNIATGEEILLKELTNSDYFGELALITESPRAASVYAEGQTLLAFLSRESFERLLGPCMNIMRRNIQDYNERMSEIADQNST